MFELETISLHNWYLVDAQDIPVCGITGIIGPTGTGKSSLLDAMQTVMAGNNRQAVRLNSAAGDRQDRTVRDYCLGCVSDVDEGRPRRDRCESTVALSFRDQDTGRVLSIGMMWAADKDQTSLEDERRFVADGYAFKIADFIETTAEGEFVVAHDSMVTRLRTKLGPKNFDLYPNASRYVGEYLQRMRPRNPPDGKRFLRAFGNTMRTKEIDDPTKFVRTMVLEPLPLDIRRVQDSIKVWRELEDEVQRLRKMLHEVRAVRTKYSSAFRRKIEEETDAFLLTHWERIGHQCEAELQDEERRKAEESRARSESLIANHDAEIETFSDELVALRAQLSQSDSSGRLDTIDALEMKTAEDRVRTLAFLAQSMRVYVQSAHLKLIERRLPQSSGEALKAALELQSLVSGRQPQEWLADANRVQQLIILVKELCKATESLSMQIDALGGEIARLADREAELSKQLQSADQSGSLMSNETADFIKELRRHNLNPVALPEIVDIKDEKWAFALEALLGRNREAVIVPAKDVERAFETLFRNRRDFANCRVVNTRKTAAQSSRLPNGSIAEVAVTDDPDARVFIDLNVGRYVRVDTTPDMDKHDFAIMSNGKTNSGLSLRVFRDQRPILGKIAKMNALAAAREELADVTAKLWESREAKRLLESAKSHLQELQNAEPSQPAEYIEHVKAAGSELSSLKRQREAVETDDDRRIKAQISDTQRMIDSYRAEKKELDAELVNATAQIKISQSAADRAREAANELHEQEDARAAEQDTQVMKSVIGIIGLADSTIAAARERIGIEMEMRPEFKADRRKYIAAEMKHIKERVRERSSSNSLADRYLNQAANALTTFFLETLGTNPLDEGATHTDKFFWVVRNEERIEKNELLPHEEKLASARVEMETALKENLLTKLGENFERLEVQLRTLNDRLGQYTFVGQRYQFTRSPNLAMKPLYDLVRKLSSDHKRGLRSIQDEAAEAAPDNESASAMAEVERLVTEQVDTKLFEDYRNYFEFELNLVSKNDRGEQTLIPFSKVVGKLSGGQREAPYYVAIAASMVSVYYPKGKAGDQVQGLGLVVFDEAFNRLDVPNTQKLVALFRSLGLQIVVATPEDRRGTLIECVDSVINVNRRAGSPDVFMTAERIGEKAKAAMVIENPEHKGVEAFRVKAAE